MTKRIFHSICFVALGVFLASVVLFMGVLYDYFSGVQKEQLRTQTELTAKAVSDEGLRYFDGLNEQTYRITWIDTDGAVLYDNQSNSEKMENHLEREEIKEALSSGTGESSRYSVTLMERSLYYAKKLPDGTVIRLSVQQNTLLTLLLGMLHTISIIFIFAVVFALVFAMRLAKKIVAPLNSLNLEEPLSNEGYDELSPLLRRIDAQQRQIRQQNDELKQNERLRREFTANVSHELKTPLHTIAGCAELLSNNMVREEDKADFIARINTEAQRMIALVEDIIGLSQLDEGAAGMKREDVDLYELASDEVRALSQAAQRAQVEIMLSGESAVIYGIPRLLQSIIHNLCDNAIKYNREGGTVTVSVKNNMDFLMLVVSDTGIGIPPEHQEHVFERFYRVDKSRSKELGGTGLGLSIVKHAARLHDAEIKLCSDINKGTAVTVIFPK